MNTRMEKDSLGEKPVPAEAYYGLQTVRAQENFPISGLRAHPRFIEAYALVKKAAARVHGELGLIPPEIADAIVRAAEEVRAGHLREQFVVDVFQMGAGTSFHMNVNEVLANRAIELLGGTKGDYHRVDPHDHVNFGQSTNDTFPTAMRIATRLLLDDLLPVLDDLETALARKAQAFDGILKAARTHLQDAVPLRLGQEFAAYAATVAKTRQRLDESAVSLEELGLGGSAAGTGLNTHPEFRFRAVARLQEWTGIPWRPAPDLREAMQSHLPVAHVAAALRLLALELTRIANDLRLLSSGPLTGFAEIILPAMQPGSSIMPGKVNPTLAEMLNMVCYQVIGHDLAVALAVQAGQLELNVMMPGMIFNLLFSLEILKNALRVFIDRGVVGITADAEICRLYAERSPALATALNPRLGYAAAAEVVQQAFAEKRRIREVVLEKGLLSENELDRLLDPFKMTEPGLPGMD